MVSVPQRATVTAVVLSAVVLSDSGNECATLLLVKGGALLKRFDVVMGHGWKVGVGVAWVPVPQRGGRGGDP